VIAAPQRRSGRSFQLKLPLGQAPDCPVWAVRAVPLSGKKRRSSFSRVGERHRHLGRRGAPASIAYVLHPLPPWGGRTITGTARMQKLPLSAYARSIRNQSMRCNCLIISALAGSPGLGRRTSAAGVGCRSPPAPAPTAIGDPAVASSLRLTNSSASTLSNDRGRDVQKRTACPTDLSPDDRA